MTTHATLGGKADYIVSDRCGTRIIEDGERAIPRAMTSLAESVGNLETAARQLSHRLVPINPAGSPFERDECVQKEAAVGAPQPVRSHVCDQLHARISQLDAITARL